jgi:phosphoribosyl-AMP cyclohydrolase / phosphoribosyl-ATP pyrophosphohydrolase
MLKIDSAQQIDAINLAHGSLLPVVVQHYATGEVLMLGYADREALQRCVSTRELWLYSRSRQELWHKGATSGNTHTVISMHADCDADAVLVRVAPAGPTCHTGARSCFGAPPTLRALGDAIEQRRHADAQTSYTARLLVNENLRLKKLGEEAVELALACAASDGQRVCEEAADVLYHTLVACAAAGVTVDEVLAELASRHQASG